MYPCGSCQEWISKIGEANPSFKVISFESLSCEKAFVKSPMELVQ